MTSVERDYLIECIRNKKVKPPLLLTTHELMMHMNGYAQCQQDMIELVMKIDEMLGERKE